MKHLENTHEKLAKKTSWKFVLSHEILPILPLNFTKFVLFLLTLGNLTLVKKIRIFQPFSAKCYEWGH